MGKTATGGQLPLISRKSAVVLKVEPGAESCVSRNRQCKPDHAKVRIKWKFANYPAPKKHTKAI